MSWREAGVRLWSRLKRGGSRGTVVLVDADESWRGAARSELEGAGYGVIEAGTALDALRRMAGRRIQVVATNYPMRLPSGSPLARVLQENGLARPVVVAVTARRGAADFHSAAADGCQAVILKPVQPAALVDLVELLTSLPCLAPG